MRATVGMHRPCTWYAYEPSSVPIARLTQRDVRHRLQARDALAETGEKGAFERKDSVFRDWVEVGGKFPPEGQTVCIQWLELLMLHA